MGLPVGRFSSVAGWSTASLVIESGLDQAEFPRLLDGRGSALDPELAVDASQMPANGAGANLEVLGHLGVGESPGNQREDFQLAAAEEASVRKFRPLLSEGEGERLLELHLATLCPDGSALVFGQGLPRRPQASLKERFRAGSYGHAVCAAQRRRHSPKAQGKFGFSFARCYTCEPLQGVCGAPGELRRAQ